MNPLARRLIALERATGASDVDLRVYGSAAEAAADTRPVGPGTEIQIIVTGVVRSLDAA
jgi:hypothetical protein